MKQPTQALVLATVAALSLGTAVMASTTANSNGDAISLPARYRDWKLISVAHEEGDLNDIRAILGNEVAIKAFRDGATPLPDGAIIARLAWTYESSAENNKVFGRNQSFIAGRPTNVQLMIKDSRKYASTGGWGFAQFKDGKPDRISEQACYSCHVPVKDRDFVFTRYSP
jgi:hypothetical protein